MITALQVVTYYVGQGFSVRWKNGLVSTDYIVTATDASEVSGLKIDFYPFTNDWEWFKLHLYHIEDMSKEMRKIYYSKCKNLDCGDTKVYVDTAFSLEFLIRNGYDIFQLIERGEAIREKPSQWFR